MSNQQRTPRPVCNADQHRIALLRQSLENFTVVASALVAEHLADAPGSKPGAQPGMQVQILPSAHITNCLAPLGKLEKPPDLESGALGVRLPRGAPRVASSEAQSNWLLTSGSRVQVPGGAPQLAPQALKRDALAF